MVRLKLNKSFSFLLSLLAVFLLIVYLSAAEFLNFVSERMASKISIIVYLNEDVSGSDIQDVKKLIESFEDVNIKSFTSSIEAYEKLKEDGRISKKLKLLGGHITLPASFDVGVTFINAERIGGIVQKLSAAQTIQKVSVPLKSIERAEELLKIVENIIKYTGWVFFAVGLFFFYLAGYMYNTLNSEKFLLARSFGISKFKFGMNNFGSRFFSGIIVALIVFSLVNFFVYFIWDGFHFNLLKSLFIVVAVGLVSGITYIISCYTYEDF